MKSAIAATFQMFLRDLNQVGKMAVRCIRGGSKGLETMLHRAFCRKPNQMSGIAPPRRLGEQVRVLEVPDGRFRVLLNHFGS